MLYFSIDGVDAGQSNNASDAKTKKVKGRYIMKTETFEGSVSSAYGEKLGAVKFSGKFEAFETFDELQKANEVQAIRNC
jgi:hypothetical protein